MTRAFLASLALAAACGSTNAPTVPDASDDPPDAPDDPPPDGPPSGSWDLVAEFPGATNPNGVWTYGYAATPDDAIIPWPDLAAAKAGPNWHIDDDPERGAIWRNDTGDDHFGVPAGEVSMHPGIGLEHVVVVFTAPHAATYSGSGALGAGDVGETRVLVRAGDAVVLDDPTTSDQPSFGFDDVALDAGDTVELWIGPQGDYTSDNTPVTLTISTP